MGVATAFSVSWDEATRIARADWAPGSVCGEAEALAVIAAVVALGHGRVSLLVDMRGIAKLEREAREHFAALGAEVMTGMALLVGSAVNSMIANFFIARQQLSVPVRQFTDEAAAVAWLRDQQ